MLPACGIPVKLLVVDGRGTATKPSMRLSSWWVAGAMGLAACTHAGRAAQAGLETGSVVGVERLAEIVEREPGFADYMLFFRARAALQGGDSETALAISDDLIKAVPDSIWTSATQVLRATILQTRHDFAAARTAYAAARDAEPRGTDLWVRAALGFAEMSQRAGSDTEAAEVALDIRRVRGHGLAFRRARRLIDRLGQSGAGITASAAFRLAEVELLLREGNARAARNVIGSLLTSELPVAERSRALWMRAQAEHALRDRRAAEDTCLALAQDDHDPFAARGLLQAATWRWNTDDDAGALALFQEMLRRFPESAQVNDALYAVGRIHQEAGRLADAGAVYEELAQRFPSTPNGTEARWRAGWVRYLDGNFSAAADWFGGLSQRSGGRLRVAAEYWQGRALARAGETETARRLLEHVATRHPTSCYAVFATASLGLAEPASPLPDKSPVRPFPTTLDDPHAQRAGILAHRGYMRLARRELDAIRINGPRRRRIVEAYAAIGEAASALRLAREIRPRTSGALARYLYPLGYWELVRRHALAEGLDPLLVLALIRQESLFEPSAVSSANARGLMQLLPTTARTLVTDSDASPDLFAPPTNIELGTRLLARLLRLYNGSRVKALAAYNAGEDAVARWQKRYAARPDDEFAELITYRETRDYVKAVLRHYQTYVRTYAANPSVTSTGSPPKDPFDMITMTSPGRADETR